MKKILTLALFGALALGAVSCSGGEDEPVPEYTVTFNADGGTPAPAAQRVKEGETVTAPATMTRTGYAFLFWSQNEASAYNFQTPVTGNITLIAKWQSEATVDPSGYRMFTSIVALSSWLSSQPSNTTETLYKVGLKDINLDSGNNWGDLGSAIDDTWKYVDLDLTGCTATTMPDGYKEGDTTYGVFVDCDRIQSVHFPEGLRNIGKYAFYQCDGLTSVTLRAGFRSVNELAFGWCPNLEGIELPAGTLYVNRAAFMRCKKLRYATLPAGLQIISNDAFWGCSALESISIPEGMEAIGDDAFYGCYALASVTLPEGLEVIGQWFDFCEFTSITIPASVKNINNAFRRVPLREMILLPSTPPELGVNPFQFIDPLLGTVTIETIKVPAASLNAYKTASGWKDYAAKIVAAGHTR